jgi:microcystin degradation protein MlrC
MGNALKGTLDITKRRVGVASLVQETNTFSPKPSTLDDFRSQSLVEGEAAGHKYRGTNTELGGALGRIEERGAVAIPLLHAWAMSSGRLTRDTLEHLCSLLRKQIEAALPLDALVLALHGAMAASGVDDADAVLLRTAREALGPDVTMHMPLRHGAGPDMRQ